LYVPYRKRQIIAAFRYSPSNDCCTANLGLFLSNKKEKA
jgi:hypothetical protein